MRIEPTNEEIAEIVGKIRRLLAKSNLEIVENQPGKPEDEVGPEGRKQLFGRIEEIKEKTVALISKNGFSYSEVGDDFSRFSDFITEISKKYVGHTSREEDSIRQWVAALQNWILCASVDW